MKRIKNVNGITLIGLVVTIIVLLILAGVTIATLMGENGILTRANSASVAQIEGHVDEEVKLAVQSAKIYAEEMATRTEDGWLAEEQLEAVTGQMRLYDLTSNKGYTVTHDDTAKTITVKYETNEYKQAKNDTDAKIIIEIKVTGNTFEIGEGIPSEPDLTPPTSTLPSIANVTTPYKPDEESIVIENSTLEKGLVVKDGNDNEWVWVVVPKTIYSNEVIATDYEGIYNALNTYASTYREGKSGQGYYWSDEWYDGSNVVGYVETTIANETVYEEAVSAGTLYINKAGIEATSGRYSSSSKYYVVNTSATLTNIDGCGLSCSKYTENYKKMLTSVFINGGFWIGRYEAGIEGTTGAIIEGDTSISSLGRSEINKGRITDESPKAISQKDAIPYNYVYCREAQKLASRMSPDSSKTSSLMFGIQWDLVCKYLEQNATELGEIPENRVAKINSSSGDWGNYSDVALTIDSSNAKQYSPSKWSAKTGEKTATSLLLSTGASNKTKVMNIYDFAGNEYEWTLEHTTTHISYPCASRGGYYNYSSSYPASGRYYDSTTYSNYNVSFRSALY